MVAFFFDIFEFGYQLSITFLITIDRIKMTKTTGNKNGFMCCGSIAQQAINIAVKPITKEK